METIEKIEQELRSNELISNPHQCAEYIATLSGELSFYLAKISDIEKLHPHQWLALRKEQKSDASTDKAWQRTEEGIEHNWYESRIKRIKALIGGLRAIIRNAEAEQFNQH